MYRTLVYKNQLVVTIFQHFQKIRNLSNLDHSPDLILIGNSLWHVKNAPEANDTLKVYQFVFRDVFKPVTFRSSIVCVFFNSACFAIKKLLPFKNWNSESIFEYVRLYRVNFVGLMWLNKVYLQETKSFSTNCLGLVTLCLL